MRRAENRVNGFLSGKRYRTGVITSYSIHYTKLYEGAIISGPVPLPTKKTVYTVLRSPHVNKKSREQFEKRIYKRLVEILNSKTETMEALTKLELPAGVNIEVKVV